MKFDSTSLPQTSDPKEVQKMGLDLLDKINKTSDSIPSGTNTTFKVGQTTYNYGQVYPYTPQTQGFGTITLGSAWWCRRFHSPMIFVMVRFISGTSTASEARIYLPVLDNTTQLLSDSSLIYITMLCGIWGNASSGIAGGYYCIVDSGVGYVNVSAQSATSAILTKQNGNSIISAGNVAVCQFELPINGWNT